MIDDEKVNPAVIKDKDNNVEYTLDFSREVIEFAERRGFEVDNVLKFPTTLIPELFFLSFRKNHKRVSRAETDKMIEQFGGLPGNLIARLIELYKQAQLIGTIRAADGEDENEKNARFAVEL